MEAERVRLEKQRRVLTPKVVILVRRAASLVSLGWKGSRSLGGWATVAHTDSPQEAAESLARARADYERRGYRPVAWDPDDTPAIPDELFSQPPLDDPAGSTADQG